MPSAEYMRAYRKSKPVQRSKPRRLAPRDARELKRYGAVLTTAERTEMAAFDALQRLNAERAARRAARRGWADGAEHTWCVPSKMSYFTEPSPFDTGRR